MSDIDRAKEAAAAHAVTFVNDGMVVGLGTGSTASYAIKMLSQRVAAGLKISGVPTSLATAALAKECGIPLVQDFDRIDLTLDGADEVDPRGNLIKGGGGALTREKIVAAASTREIIIVDKSKLVKRLGKFPLPIEVLPFGVNFVKRRLREAYGVRATTRTSDGSVICTDNGNYVVDCEFERINAPEKLTVELNGIPGVVENGLFVGLTYLVIAGKESGETETFSLASKKE